MTWDNIRTGLRAPFKPTQLRWRQGRAGLQLAYIDARDVANRLDEVVGIENWQDRYEEVAGRMICYLSIRCDGEWITKSDGAGDTNIEAEKGGISDALKRAAQKFGIGRYLYYLPKNASPDNLPRWAVPNDV